MNGRPFTQDEKRYALRLRDDGESTKVVLFLLARKKTAVRTLQRLWIESGRKQCRSCGRRISGRGADCNTCTPLRKSKDRWFRREYGLSSPQIQQIKEKQNGRCLICDRETELDVDHDHSTGRIRGLLCRSCNLGIGLFHDSSELLQKAVKYLG